MVGFITRNEIVANARLVAELYGVDVLLRCLSTRPGETFLGIVAESNWPTPNKGHQMFTVTWHYDDGGIGSFREATFGSYDSAVRAFLNTTRNVSPMAPALVSAVLVGAGGFVHEFFAPVSDGSLIEQ
jgi:hypothetical protein